MSLKGPVAPPEEGKRRRRMGKGGSKSIHSHITLPPSLPPSPGEEVEYSVYGFTKPNQRDAFILSEMAVYFGGAAVLLGATGAKIRRQGRREGGRRGEG